LRYNIPEGVFLMSVEVCQERLEKLNAELDRIIGVLVNSYDPQKIILFGSLVSGSVHEWSDIDLIVVKESDKGFYDRLEEVALLVMPKVGTDIFVYTPEEFEVKQDLLFFKEEVFGKGKVLYDVQASRYYTGRMLSV
jgi:predicted nucleotidyltransferase